MSELKAGRIELLELDIDIRLVNLMHEAGGLALITSSNVKDLIVRSHFKAVEDVRSSDSPDDFYLDHGYSPPVDFYNPIPPQWLESDYLSADEEIINFYEKRWQVKITDCDFEQAAKYMRGAYGSAHSITYLIERRLG
jgi:hypothetical protein